MTVATRANRECKIRPMMIWSGDLVGLMIRGKAAYFYPAVAPAKAWRLRGPRDNSPPVGGGCLWERFPEFSPDVHGHSDYLNCRPKQFER